MTTSRTTAPAGPWERKRTPETRDVENLLRSRGFEHVDAYRYNSASIRLRVIDPEFEGLPIEKRDALVEPHLKELPERTQGDIVFLLTLAPSELPPAAASREQWLNREFENPGQSRL